MFTEISFSRSEAFKDVRRVEEELLYDVDKLTKIAKEVLSNVNDILTAESRKRRITLGSCCLAGSFFFGLSVFALCKGATAIGATGSALSESCAVFSGWTAFMAPKQYDVQSHAIDYFTDLFQQFMNQPEDVRVFPLMQSYNTINQKPCYSVLMQALKEAYVKSGKKTELTDQWDALLKNFQEVSLSDKNNFDELNVQFWNKFSLPAVPPENYKYLLSNPGTTLYIPGMAINSFVDQIRNDCKDGLFSQLLDKSECSATVKEDLPQIL